MTAKLADILPFPVPHPSAAQLDQAEADHRARAERERRARVEARLATLRTLGAPERILRALASAHGHTGPMAALARIPRDSVVVLAGGVGIGKTTAALSWLACAPGRPWFATARKWAASPPWSRDWESARVAVLDDLGTEDLDNRFRARFDDLIAFYHGQLRGLVITTNLHAGAFKARYGPRVESRIHEAGVFLALDGQDLRDTGSNR